MVVDVLVNVAFDFFISNSCKEKMLKPTLYANLSISSFA
jgi:hypothetical protein